MMRARPALFAPSVWPAVAAVPVGLVAFGVVLVALGLRLWGVWYGLPYLYQTDEPFLVLPAWRMYQTGDMSPHFWDYPGLQIYSILVLIWVRELLAPVFPMLGQNGEYLLIRLLNVAYATATVYLVYRIGARHLGRWAGVVAAALLALSEQHNLMSHFAKVDVVATFYVTAALAAAAAVVDRPTWRAYAAAGALVGLSAAGKYPAATIGSAVLVAHLLAWRWRSAHEVGRLVAAGACAFAAFAITCPYTFVDMATFLREFNSSVVDWAATGHDGWDGDVTVSYLRWLFWSPDGAISWLALLGAGLGLARRPKTVLLVGVFPVIFFLELTTLWNIRFPWYVLPMYPFLTLLAGFGAVEAFRRLAAIGRPIQAGWLALVLAALAYQGAAAWDKSASLAEDDVRTIALRWVDANLPPGSRIVREGYTPEIGPGFNATLIWRAIDREPAWYRAEKVEYLVLGNFLYQRYFDNPVKYAAQVGQYRALMDMGELVQRIEGPEMGTRAGVVLVYRMRQ